MLRCSKFQILIIIITVTPSKMKPIVLLVLFFKVLVVLSFTTTHLNIPIQTSTKMSSTDSADAIVASDTIGLVVEAEIQPDRIDEFLVMIEKNAKGSRAEAGCLRFGKIYLLDGNVNSCDVVSCRIHFFCFIKSHDCSIH